MRLTCDSLDDARSAAEAAMYLASYLSNKRAHEREICACDVCQAYRNLRSAVQFLGAEANAQYPGTS